MMNDEVKRGPGRPRKTPEDVMTPTQVIEALNVKPKEDDYGLTAASPQIMAPEPKVEGPKLYTFKMLKGHNFPNPDFKVIDVDADGNWQEPREPVLGIEYGDHTKVWPGMLVMVAGPLAKRFDETKAGKRVDKYD